MGQQCGCTDDIRTRPPSVAADGSETGTDDSKRRSPAGSETASPAPPIESGSPVEETVMAQIINLQKMFSNGEITAEQYMMMTESLVKLMTLQAEVSRGSPSHAFSLANASSLEHRTTYTHRPTVECMALIQLTERVAAVELHLVENASLLRNMICDVPPRAKENLYEVAVISSPRQVKTLFMDMLLDKPSYGGVVVITFNSSDPAGPEDTLSGDSAYRALLWRVTNALIGKQCYWNDLEKLPFDVIEDEVRSLWSRMPKDGGSPVEFVPCLLVDELTILTDALPNDNERFDFWVHLNRLLQPLGRWTGERTVWAGTSLVYTGSTSKSRSIMSAFGTGPRYIKLPEYTPGSLDTMLGTFAKK